MRENGQAITLDRLYIYPIKSLKGIALDEARVERRGLQYDRRWMLVDEANMFFTQREHPRMATVSLNLETEGLRASADGMEDLLIPYVPPVPELRTVTVWRSVCQALTVATHVDEWFSRFLQTPCRLVYMPDETRREVNPLFAISQDIVSFADGYPFMLLGEASLDELNGRLNATPVPMNRFRPNFVLKGTPAFAEDEWKEILIGETVFYLVKPCERCQIPTIDQDRGARAGPEPLRQLATYRTFDNKVLFGQYLIAQAEGGGLRVGDEVRIIARQDNGTGDGHLL
jgi:MOSC domain-containing protein